MTCGSARSKPRSLAMMASYRFWKWVTFAGGIAGRGEEVAKKIEVREHDRMLIWVDVTRVAEDSLERPLVTVQVAGQKVTALLGVLEVERVEKGGNWPGV